ncbi:hypothetical protein [Paenibacillus sp. YYML68]|uniref:hypothetical protein n=1 Tax=Paenibacillus sp. YYML68 TaxID=2909250 RepID=UPI0024937009|nr:hypothetical protein [Paenibacillus sp. YYML68]
MQAITGSFFMEKARRTEADRLVRWLKPLRNERGGVHLLLTALLAMSFAVLLLATGWNSLVHGHTVNKAKTLLDQAVRAASLNIVPEQAAMGRLVWDEAAGRADFAQYVRLNFKLHDDMRPKTNSPLTAAPIVHRLEFVTNPTYPYTLSRSITVHSGTDRQTTRSVSVTVFGPSVVAIVELEQRQLGTGRTEPVVISSAANVRLR